VLTPGDDVTIITYGSMTAEGRKATAVLQQEGVSAELIDLRSIVPFDLDTVITSVEKTGRARSINREKFNRLSPAYQKRLVRQAIASVQGNLRRISMGHMQQVLELFHNTVMGKKIDLPGQLMAVANPNGVEIQRNSPQEKSTSFFREEDFSFTKELLIPGETEIEKAGISLHAEILSSESWVDDLKKFPHRACFDFDKTGNGVKARFFRPGDRFVPLGMKGRKKLKSFFIDEKIPRESRESIPILTTRKDDIIWVYGKRIAEPFRVTEKTRKILSIQGNGDFQNVSH